MGARRIEIVRQLDLARLAGLRSEGEFFWADFDLTDDLDLDQITEAFGISAEDAEPLRDFTRGGSPARRIHVGDDLVVFPYWCAADADAVPPADPALFRVNVLLHGDFLLTVHRKAFDLPAAAGVRRIPAGRSEGYVVYSALDGMTNTILETVATMELEIGRVERALLDQGMRPSADDKATVSDLRARLTDLRFRIGPERALFERVGEEISLIETLEGASADYYDRILAQLDRAVDRIDAASQALSHALEIQLNETTYRLTLVATVFLPLTFIVGFFGMNFAWMVDHVGSEADFLIWGVGSWLVPMVLALVYLRVRDSVKRSHISHQRP